MVVTPYLLLTDTVSGTEKCFVSIIPPDLSAEQMSFEITYMERQIVCLDLCYGV